MQKLPFATADTHLRHMVGDSMVQVLSLTYENMALRNEIERLKAELEAAKAPAPTKEPKK